MLILRSLIQSPQLNVIKTHSKNNCIHFAISLITCFGSVVLEKCVHEACKFAILFLHELLIGAYLDDTSILKENNLIHLRQKTQRIGHEYSSLEYHTKMNYTLNNLL
jgi:hypothetical protein